MESARPARPVPWSRVYGASRVYGPSRRKRGPAPAPAPAPAAPMEKVPTDLREVARSTRLLRIEGFSSMPTTNHMSMDGHFVKTTWSVYGYDWEVRFYPAMKAGLPTPTSSTLVFDTWVAVELALPSTSGEGEALMGARLSCRLVDPRGKLIPSGGDHPPPSLQNIVAFLVPRKHLAESGYLKHDSLTVECTIMVLMKSPDTTVLPDKQVPMPSSNLNLDLAKLQQSKTGADVTFIVSGESFAAHKLILAARSPVFSAEFFGDFGEKNAQQIQVEGIEAPTFKAMLDFIYTDAVSEFDQQSEDGAALAQHVLVAADRYGLDRLKLICEAKIYDGIKAGTAATTLAFAEQHNCSQLKAKCIEFIVSTPDILDEVLATDGYTHLVESHRARGRKRQKQGI